MDVIDHVNPVSVPITGVIATAAIRTDGSNESTAIDSSGSIGQSTPTPTEAVVVPVDIPIVILGSTEPINLSVPHINEEMIKKIIGIPVLANGPNIYQIALVHEITPRITKAKKDVAILDYYKKSRKELISVGRSLLIPLVHKYLHYRYLKQSEDFIENIRSKVVSKANCAIIAKKLGLDNYLVVPSLTVDDNMLADTFKALLGAISIDIDIMQAERFMIDSITSFIDINAMVIEGNHKTIMWRYSIKKRYCIPKYITTESVTSDTVWGNGAIADVERTIYNCNMIIKRKPGIKSDNESSSTEDEYVLSESDDEDSSNIVLMSAGIGNTKADAEYNAAKNAIDMVVIPGIEDINKISITKLFNMIDMEF